MPRPNRPRSIAGERSLARRVAHERDILGWSYEGLALRMTKAGCPINPSGLYKIEKANPPRRITVDELVAFGEVFSLPVEELLMPPEAAAKAELATLMTGWDSARKAFNAAAAAESESWDRLKTFVSGHPEISEVVEQVTASWAETYFDTDDAPSVMAVQMWHLTDSPDWKDRMKSVLDDQIRRRR